MCTVAWVTLAMACWLSLNQHDDKSWRELLPCSFIVIWISRCPCLYHNWFCPWEVFGWIISVLQPKEQMAMEKIYIKDKTLRITEWRPYNGTLSKCTSRGSVRRIAHAHIYSMHVHASYITCQREFPTVHFAHAVGLTITAVTLNQDVLERRQIPHFNGSFGSGRIWERNSEHHNELWSRLCFDGSVSSRSGQPQSLPAVPWLCATRWEILLTVLRYAVLAWISGVLSPHFRFDTHQVGSSF